MRFYVSLSLLAFYLTQILVSVAFVKPTFRTKNQINESLKIITPNNIPLILEQPEDSESWEDGEIPWTFVVDKNNKNKSDNSTFLQKTVIPPFVPMSPAQIAFLLIN